MSKNCVDIVRPFVAELDDTHRVQLVGGVGSFVLKNESAEIRPDEKLIIAPCDMDLSEIGQFRNDGNRRDLDVLVKSTDPTKISEVESIAEATVGKELVLSVFGLHSINKLRKQRKNSILSLGKVWVADRYVTEQNDQIVEAKKALFPFAVDMDLESLEDWHLIIGKDKPIPIPHPGTVVLNYLTRSISGLRPKDDKKINELGHNIFAKAPELVDWIADGPGQSQLELARLLHTLREPSNGEVIKVGGKLEIKSYSADELATHSATLLSDNPNLAHGALVISRVKARALHVVESQEAIVTAYQRYVEKHLGFIVSNR